MKHHSVAVLALLLAGALPVFASGMESDAGMSSRNSRDFVPSAPALAAVGTPAPEKAAPASNPEVAAIWPFGGNDKPEASAKPTTPKSPRKAFFLSMLLPGLGEYYTGAKRGIAFLGVEALGWWMYAHYTGKGNDQEETFERFANENWRYSGAEGEYSYVEWFANRLVKNSLSTTDLPKNYADLSMNPTYMDSVTNILKDKDTLVNHTLPSTKTQQYYEMIGKYPQFVYGWKDIVQYTESVDTNGNKVRHYINPGLVDAEGKATGNYDADIRNVKSSMRDQYMNMRKDSNDNLKMGQNGVSLLLLNRVVSAIDAARLAYHRNKSMESELSMVRVNLVQKHILDHEVPILMVSKKF